MSIVSVPGRRKRRTQLPIHMKRRKTCVRLVTVSWSCSGEEHALLYFLRNVKTTEEIISPYFCSFDTCLWHILDSWHVWCTKTIVKRVWLRIQQRKLHYGEAFWKANYFQCLTRLLKNDFGKSMPCSLNLCSVMRHARKHLVSVNTIRRMPCHFGEVDELPNIAWSEDQLECWTIILDMVEAVSLGTWCSATFLHAPPVSGMREQSHSLALCSEKNCLKECSSVPFPRPNCLQECSSIPDPRPNHPRNFATKLIKHSTPGIRDKFLGHNVNQTLLGAASTAKVRETSHRHQYNMQTERLIRLSHNKHNKSLRRLSIYKL